MKTALYVFFTLSIVSTVIGLAIILMDRPSENVNIQAVGCICAGIVFAVLSLHFKAVN
jgi:heme/copper-type cytochrome/quinol oxidase subunit 4